MYFFVSWAVAVFCLATAAPHCAARHIPHGRFHVNHTSPESTAVADLTSTQRDTSSGSVQSLHEDLLRKSTVHHTPGLLLPSVSDQVNRYDWRHLVPQKDLQVYYEEGGSGTSAAYVSFRDLKHPTVVLEHSHFVSQVQCIGQKLWVTFSDQGVAKFALNAWKTENPSNIVIVTNSASCSFGFPAERGWLLVTSVKARGASEIVCNFSEVPAKEVSKTVVVNFGRINGGPPPKIPPVAHLPKPGAGSSRPARTSTSSTNRAATHRQSSSVSTPHFPGWPQTFSLRKQSSTSSFSRTVIPGSTKSAVASTSRLSSSYAAVESSSKNSWPSSSYSTTQLAANISQSAASAEKITVSFISPNTSVLPTSSNSFSAMPTTLSSITVFSNTQLSVASNSSPDNNLLPTQSGSPSGTTTILDAELSTTSPVLATTSLSMSSNSSTSGSASPASTQPSNSIQDFDTILDDSIGYLDPSSSGFWSQLLPSVPSSQTSTFGTATKRLHRRDFDLVSVASSLTQAVSSAVSSAASTVDSAVQSASGSFASAVASVVSAAVGILNSLSPFTLGPFPFSATPQNTDTSDFGPAVILSQSSGSSGGVTGQLTTYCVGCGATGSFTLTGTVVFDAEEGISSAVFDIAGNIHAQLELAAVASVSFSESTEKNIFTQGLPALTVTGLIVIGPSVSLDVGATADFSITGGLAAGYQLDWPAITAHFDLTNDIYSANGLIPTGSPIFDYEGDVKASATVYGLISLTFGIDILSGKYKANVGLVDKPEIDTSAEAVVYTDYQLSQMDDGTVYCDGDSLTLSFLDSAYADVVFLNATKTYPLTSWLGPSLSTCIGTESTVSHSSAATTTDPEDPDPTDPADVEDPSNGDDSTSTTDSSTPTASPAATATTQEPASTSTDNSNTSSLPELTTTAPTSGPTATDPSATSTPSHDSTATTSDDSTTTATDETTTAATDESTTTTDTDESTSTTATDESTTTPTDEIKSTTASDESTATTMASDMSVTTTATDESPTITATDESPNTTATDDKLTPTATDENATTTDGSATITTDDSATATTTDNSATATTIDDSATATTTDDSVTATTTDNIATATMTDNSATAMTTDDSATVTTEPSTAATTVSDESNSTTATATSTAAVTVEAECDPVALADGYCCDIPPPPIVDTSVAYGIWEYCLTVSAADAAWAEWEDCGGEDVDPSSPDLSEFISCSLGYLDEIPVDSTSACDIWEPNDMDQYYICMMETLYYSTKYKDLALLVDGSADKRRKRDSATSLADATIQDAINGTAFISWAADGNLIVSNASNSFSSLDGNIVGDTESRLLHLYSDTIADRGVSRIRLASLDLMPLTSVLVTLASMSVPSESSPVLVAFTSAGSFYYLITCIMDEQAPKIFLVADVVSGVSTLQSPSVQDTITGGSVTECGLMAWTTG